MVDKNLARPGIPAIFYGAAGKNVAIDKSEMQKLKDWTKNLYNPLLLSGETGRGKTYCAVALMYLLESWNCPWYEMLFISVPQLNQEWLANMNNHSENHLSLYKMQNKKVLILDDIGIRKPTESFLEYLHALIDYRCGNKELITIFTTNCSASEMTKLLGPRIVSRMSEAVTIKFEGKDYRSRK